MNDLKERLRHGKLCLGAWITIPSPTVVDSLADCGFHWVALDMEHTAIGLETAEACIIAAERWKISCLARLPNADPFLARRLLDLGAVGLIIPAVADAAAFDDFARHCLFPPHGRRGVGLPRANVYGAAFDAYRSGFQPVLVAQIESRAGVASVTALARQTHVDAFFAGPYDLSEDLGIPGKFEDQRFVAALQEARTAAEQNAKPFGIHQVDPDPQKLKMRIVEGYRFIAYGTDVIAMRSALRYPREILEN